jgi:hypothetical protein
MPGIHLCDHMLGWLEPAAAQTVFCGCRQTWCSTGRKAMEWFSQKTSIAGIQIPNWVIVLGAVIVVLLIYNSMH